MSSGNTRRSKCHKTICCEKYQISVYVWLYGMNEVRSYFWQKWHLDHLVLPPLKYQILNSKGTSAWSTSSNLCVPCILVCGGLHTLYISFGTKFACNPVKLNISNCKESYSKNVYSEMFETIIRIILKKSPKIPLT